MDQVAAVVEALPPGERDSVMLLAGSYGEAGAIDHFGSSRGLPPAHSPHNHYWYFRRPRDDAATVVAIRWPPRTLTGLFDGCDQVATVDNGLGVDNELQGAPVFVCRGLKGSWADLWPRMKFLS